MIFCGFLMQKGIKNISLLLVTLLFSVTLGAQNLPMGEKTLRPATDSVAMARGAARRDSLLANRAARVGMLGDSLHAKENRAIDSLLVLPSDTAGKRKERNFLDEIINGKNKDSLYYDVRGKMVHIYEQGDVTYGNMNIKADYMRVSMDSKEILAYGKADTSVYGHTKAAVELLAETLEKKGCPKVVVNDLARCDMAEAVEDAFRYGKLVLATTTYNGDIFPFMKEFIHHLTERNYQNRTIGLMENGSWAPVAAKVMKTMFEKSKNITFTDTSVKLLSALSDDSRAQIDALATELLR